MGQAKVRQLRTAAAVMDGEPVVLALGERSARRLAALRAAAEGADLAVAAATGQRDALREKYQEAVGGLLEANGVEVDAAHPAEIAHDPDRGSLTITRKTGPPPAPDAGQLGSASDASAPASATGG